MEIIAGITKVDELEHIVCGRYRSHANEGDPNKLEVVEIVNARLGHTVVEGGHPEGRIAVFSRFITQDEHAKRKASYSSSPEQYMEDLLKNTSL